jgi:hypothetical protein
MAMLMDIKLPGISGFMEALERAMKFAENTQNSPVVILPQSPQIPTTVSLSSLTT